MTWALLVPAVSAVAADAQPQTFAVGQVIALEDTPHLFVRDEAGTFHLAADAPALTGRDVDWRTRKDVSADALRQYRLGEPWLTMALVKIGDSIYLPQAQADGSAPVLRLINSVDDLGQIGVNAENYGRVVLDQQTWEARYGLRVGALRVDDFSLTNRLMLPQVEESSRRETEDGIA